MPVNQDKKGFTLIEVLVAMAILAICLGAIMSMFSAISMANVKSEIRTKMAETLNGYVETVVNGNFNNITTKTYADNVTIRNFTIPYKITFTVKSSSLPGGIEKKAIDAKIEWKYSGQPYNYTLATVATNE